MRICVLGAGVIGLTTVYFLAKAGHRVTIIDRNGLPAQEASYANQSDIASLSTVQHTNFGRTSIIKGRDA